MVAVANTPSQVVLLAEAIKSQEFVDVILNYISCGQIDPFIAFHKK